MDLPVQDLRRNANGDDQAVRRSSAQGTLDAFSSSATEFFHVGPLAEVEEYLGRLQALITRLAVEARRRRKAEMAERCAVCGNPWKHRLPDGGRVPVGLQFWKMEDGSTLNLYACDAACFSKLQYQVEKRTYQIRKDKETAAVEERQDLLAIRRKRKSL